jgi:hypothetical protein
MPTFGARAAAAIPFERKELSRRGAPPQWISGGALAALVRRGWSGAFSRAVRRLSALSRAIAGSQSAGSDHQAKSPGACAPGLRVI